MESPPEERSIGGAFLFSAPSSAAAGVDVEEEDGDGEDAEAEAAAEEGSSPAARAAPLRSTSELAAAANQTPVSRMFLKRKRERE